MKTFEILSKKLNKKIQVFVRFDFLNLVFSKKSKSTRLGLGLSIRIVTKRQKVKKYSFWEKIDY
jgi:hypothetical protein